MKWTSHHLFKLLFQQINVTTAALSEERNAFPNFSFQLLFFFFQIHYIFFRIFYCSLCICYFLQLLENASISTDLSIKQKNEWVHNFEQWNISELYLRLPAIVFYLTNIFPLLSQISFRIFYINYSNHPSVVFYILFFRDYRVFLIVIRKHHTEHTFSPNTDQIKWKKKKTAKRIQIIVYRYLRAAKNWLTCT